MNNNNSLTTLKDALAHIQSNLISIDQTEKLSLAESLGRVLAQNIISNINVPSHTNSAMDGFAIQQVDLLDSGSFEIVGTVLAGEVYKAPVNPRECVRIMTGAPMPEGLDFVVPQEYVKLEGLLNQSVNIKGYEGGNNVRQAGEDLSIGGIALDQGRQLTANDIGLLASLGLTHISAYRKLKVAFFSTGDELRRPGEKLESGQIYDSNSYSIYGMLQSLNIEPINLGLVKDDPDKIRAAFLKAAKEADVVLTSGGVSVGKADYIKQVLEEVGQIDLWRLSIKPGKPLAFGKINQAYFFGLPGNPVSSAVVFYKIVKPMLKVLMGQRQNIYPLALSAKSGSEIRKKSKRMEFMRGILSQGAHGPEVSVSQNQGSGILSSMYKANCLVVLDEDTTQVNVGDMVKVEPFYGLL